MNEQTQENLQKLNEVDLLFLALGEIKDITEKFLEINERLEDNCTQNQKRITAVGNNPNLWGNEEYMVPFKCFVCYKTGGKPVLRLIIQNGELDINRMINDMQMPLNEKIELLIKELEGVSSVCMRKIEEKDFHEEKVQLRKMSDAIIKKLESNTSIDTLTPLGAVMKEVKK